MEGYTPFPTLGRAGKRVRHLTGRRGGCIHASSPHPGRDLLAVARDRGIGLRSTSPPNVEGIRKFPQISGGRDYRPKSLLTQDLLSLQ